MEITEVIHSDHTISELSAGTPPIARLRPGHVVRIDTSDMSYRSITAEDIDSGKVNFREINRLTGPIFVEGAEPGDALGFTILHIELGTIAYVPYVARWRYPTFPRANSSMASYSIQNGSEILSGGVSIEVRPMVGCVATAPAEGKLSSMSPADNTGGNLDIHHVCECATVWLPVETPGALFAIGDIHASMGANEPLGAGLECGGSIIGVFHLARGTQLSGPRIESAGSIHFVGSHRDDDAIARQTAVRAAWDWLSSDCGLADEVALAVCAAALDITLGGPAGCNYVASFDVARLRSSGISSPLLIDGHPTSTDA